jgi:hypothetical protein
MRTPVASNNFSYNQEFASGDCPRTAGGQRRIAMFDDHHA